MKLYLDEAELIQHRNELESLEEYVPLLLHMYMDTAKYFKNNEKNSKVIREYKKHRMGLVASTDESEFHINDIGDWLKQHPEYKEYIIIEK